MTYPQQQPYGIPPAQFIPPPAPVPGPERPSYPQPVQNGAPAGADPFADPRNFAGLAPKIRDLQGRTVIMVPTRIDETSLDPSNKPRPTAYFDLVVCDGGPIEFGSDQQKGTPNTHRCDTPAYFRNTMAGNSNIVNALRDQVGRGIVLGTVIRSDVGMKPFNLVKVDDPAKRQQAQNIWFAIQSGQFTSPAPVPLFSGAAQMYAPPIQPAGYQWPAGYTGPAQPQAPAPASQAPAGPPAGWPAEVWAGLSDEQRAQVLASLPPTTAAAPPDRPLAPPW